MASSDSQSFSGFVTGDKQFQVPRYQRNYSWEKEHVDDLWEDLVEAVEMDRDHYIGTFLLMEEETDEGVLHNIIDGQQRLTTLTILLFELQERLDDLGKETDARKIRGEYIARYGTQKLTLAGDDKTFFKGTILENMLDDDREAQKEDALSDVETNSPSQDRLLTTKKTLRNYLSDGVPAIASHEDPAEFYADLYQKIQSLPLLEYTVDSRSEAARIFQTVNDRGKDLTDLEITKSYLMHRISLLEEGDQADAYIERIQDSFNKIYDSIENISSGPSEDRVQRYHFIMWNIGWGVGWNDRYYQDHLEYTKEHFRSVGDVEEIMDYVYELERMFRQLDELYNHSDRIDNERIDRHLSDLFLAGRLGNFYPLLMVAYDQYKSDVISEDEFCSLLGKIETFIVRTYIIEQKSADTGRTRAYPLARRLYYNVKDEDPDGVSQLDIAGVISRIERYTHDYCSDSKLDSTLGDSNVYKYFQGSNRLNELRLLLYTFESYLESGEEDIQFRAVDVVNNKDDRFWVEHVWPQTPSDGFSGEIKTLINEHKHRLGNLALMTQEDDIVMGNDTFEEKKAKFNGSKIRMLEEIFANETWGVGQIEHREKEMLRVIRERWPDEYEST